MVVPSGQGYMDPYLQQAGTSFLLSSGGYDLAAGITNGCNLACQWCANSSKLKGVRYMSIGLYRAVIANHPSEVAFGLGEALTHPEISDFVDATLAKPIALEIQTNMFDIHVLEQIMGDFGSNRALRFRLSAGKMYYEEFERRSVDYFRHLKDVRKLAKQYRANTFVHLVTANAKADKRLLRRICRVMQINSAYAPGASQIKDVGLGRNCPKASTCGGVDDFRKTNINLSPDGKVFATSRAWYEGNDGQVLLQISEQMAQTKRVQLSSVDD